MHNNGLFVSWRHSCCKLVYPATCNTALTCSQLGIVVGLVSTCVQSVGLTLQRKSHMLEDEKEDHLPKRAPYRRRRWQIGMFLFLLANIVGSSIQITTLPLPLLSTLQASGLVFNALLASLLLQEPFTLRTGLGTLLVAIGALLISLFSAMPEPSHNLDQLLDLLVERDFVVWMSLTVLLVVAVLAATFFLQHCIPVHRRQRSRIRLARGMAYGLVSSVLSAHALLLAKSAVELLVRTIADHVNQFNRYQSWLLLLFFLFLALTQLYYLHRGLKLVSTSILYPFVFCVYNIVAILDGLIYFRQMHLLPPLYAGLMALGVVILLLGILALSWRLSDDDDSDTPTSHLKVELPHSALGPGMGLVDDSSAQDDASDLETDEEGAAGETAPLINHHRRRHTMRDSALLIGKQRRQRRRRSTVREVENIWDELRDDDEHGHYGALDGHHVRHHSGTSLAVHSSTTPGDADDVPQDQRLGFGRKRAKTAPPGRSRGGKRRRASTLLAGGVSQDDLGSLFSQGWHRLGTWRKGSRPPSSGAAEVESGVAGSDAGTLEVQSSRATHADRDDSEA